MGDFRALLVEDFAGLAALVSGCYPGDGLQYALLIFNCACTIEIIINVLPMSKPRKYTSNSRGRCLELNFENLLYRSISER